MKKLMVIWVFSILAGSLTGQIESIEPWRTIGYKAKLNGDYTLAVEYYRKILEVEPGDYDARLAVGKLLILTEEYQEAISIFESIYFEDETDVEAMNGLGKCYGLLGMDSLSVAWYEQALGYLPENAMQHLYLAEAYGNAGRETDAILSYEKVLEIDDTYAEAWAGIGKMYYWSDKPATSMKYYKRALELDPGNDDLLEEISQVKTEMRWGLTLKISPVREEEESYTINAIVSRLKLEKRISDHISLDANVLVDYSHRDYTGEMSDTNRWYNSSWIQASYLQRHHTISAYAGYSNTDDKFSSYGAIWKMKYDPGKFIVKNHLQAGYDYYYYWNRVGATSVSDECSAGYSFVELSLRGAFGLVDPVYTIDYSNGASGEIRKNPYKTYAVSLNFKVLKRPDLKIGLNHSFLDYKYKSPLYYSPSGRSLTGASATVYHPMGNFYVYGSFAYNLGHEYNYEETEANEFDKVKMNVDNWSAQLELGYKCRLIEFSIGASNFYNPYYQNITVFASCKVLF